ncbi:MAG: hypothetical protein ACYDBY_19840 [Thermoanaerobaculia bacterium]
MKAARVVIVLAAFAVACGPKEKMPEASAASGSATPARETARPASEPVPDGDPCAVLRAPMVRYDAAGSPLAFSFEMPEGFVPKDFSKGETVNVDVTRDLDGDRSDEYILRLAYPTKLVAGPDKLVEVWRKLPTTVKVLEKSVGGRTMYVQRTKVGTMTGFVALFPAPGSPAAAYSVMGGLTSAPKPCREEAAEVLEQMLLSFEPNPSIGAIPKG